MPFPAVRLEQYPRESILKRRYNAWTTEISKRREQVQCPSLASACLSQGGQHTGSSKGAGIFPACSKLQLSEAATGTSKTNNSFQHSSLSARPPASKVTGKAHSYPQSSHTTSAFTWHKAEEGAVRSRRSAKEWGRKGTFLLSLTSGRCVLSRSKLQPQSEREKCLSQHSKAWSWANYLKSKSWAL